MHFATILSLVGATMCIGVYTLQRRWLMAAAWVFFGAYILFDKVVRVPGMPAWLVESFVVAWFVLALGGVVQMFRQRRAAAAK
ncbi:hypothetical protein [Pseudoduganella namucuonensis]|uniref:Uncharacterized protein n=1 Tax=Pseudoduganella namucuonensis TaxID=1035707 RepID=A0A1I7IBH3_9BURK|nr:hypothetical protein [Pseudoduganella namucuonensis]SFU70238.1 hypothetical protein SAMN05216552_1007243 [Pseudoduganella namucuonensis]